MRSAVGRPLRLAYADPPYPGCAARYYADHPDYAGEVDHRALVEALVEFDGWALSTSAAALPSVLALCPPGVRVAAWVRGERPAASYEPLNAWEPVIYHGGRAYLSAIENRRIDALVHGARARTTDPRRVIGAKPAAFAYWLFDLLGALPGDDFADLFPGSGGIERAWRLYASPEGPHDDGSLDASLDVEVDASHVDVPDASAEALDDGSLAVRLLTCARFDDTRNGPGAGGKPDRDRWQSDSPGSRRALAGERTSTRAVVEGIRTTAAVL